MTSPAFEAFLARIYVDDEARQRFLADPEAVAAGAGLSPTECRALARIDRAGLELAAVAFAHKRRHHHPRAVSWWRRVWTYLTRGRRR